MAVRSTQQPLEVLGQASAPSVRNTQQPLEVLGQASAPSVRNTQLVLEVLYGEKLPRSPVMQPGVFPSVWLTGYGRRRD